MTTSEDNRRRTSGEGLCGTVALPKAQRRRVERHDERRSEACSVQVYSSSRSRVASRIRGEEAW